MGDAERRSVGVVNRVGVAAEMLKAFSWQITIHNGMYLAGFHASISHICYHLKLYLRAGTLILGPERRKIDVRTQSMMIFLLNVASKPTSASLSSVCSSLFDLL